MPCIVHMIRNSTKFVSYKDLKTVCRDLKEVYSTINAETGHEALEEFGKKWNDKYPMIQASWERNRNNLTEFQCNRIIELQFTKNYKKQVKFPG